MLYFYEKYNSVYHSGSTYYTYEQGSWTYGGRTTTSSTSFNADDWAFSSSSGYYSTNSYSYTAGGGQSHDFVQSDTKIYRYDWIDDTAFDWYTQTATKTQHTTSGYYSKGSYIETVTAEEGTYPSNERHSDGYWYVKKTLAEVVTITSPVGGETWVNENTVSWTLKAGLQSHVQITTDGTNFTDIVALTTNTSYLLDVSPYPDTTTAKIRIRAYDGATYGPWATSNTFTIIHKTKVGEYRTQGVILPIYDPSVGMDNKNQFRTVVNGTVACFELVDTTDPLATPFRVSTNQGIKAIGGE